MKAILRSTLKLSGAAQAEAHGSPTTSLKLDLLRSLNGDASKPATLNKIVLVDAEGDERDHAALSSTGWSFTGAASWRKAYQPASITCTASYTVAKIRLYGDTSLYFEHTLPQPIEVLDGSTINATVNITVTVTLQHVQGGENAAAQPLAAYPQTLIRRFTTGEDRGRKINRVTLWDGDAYVAMLIGSTSIDEAMLRYSLTASFTPASSVTIDRYRYVIELGPDVALVTMNKLTLGPDMTHIWSLTLQL